MSYTKLNVAELVQKSEAELQELLKNKKMELFETRMKLKTMQLQDTSLVSKIRKDIARIKTAMRQKRGN
ncbi:50S ribosomal protein L29 [Caminibacter profundus]|jgi:large subunit ribosomal protein L29|uniref:Large ribosomal subunit protein uL29 n=2 Tax=Caminibacter TaxID=191301 RepID=A0AAI9AG44_9BACT|nr:MULTISPECIES: 50S ribosomal protein L29 [Caminibacter]EDM22869.1 50S ribosomal protein L29 [Caminibacter mediatlanticus TB-2]QCI28998.1 50S ribosomal protein L29 [Caminibacter pacificus]QCT93988.1 50S ribosomal protein L29 [Caminibacter mediatlanticus TB-2]ROR39193.1 large subunit ribosomal protein L29 [Caminibacter pacificus]